MTNPEIGTIIPSIRNNKSAAMSNRTGDLTINDGATGYPGMLPTLGLTKYKAIDLQTDKRNPFRVQ